MDHTVLPANNTISAFTPSRRASPPSGQYCSREIPVLMELFGEADESLFGSILANSNHVLQLYLPE